MTNRRQFLKASSAALAVTSLVACGGRDKEPVAGVPRSLFGEDSTAEEVTARLDLSGRLAIVTGCTSGIGFETMRVLALRGAHVVGTSRSLERAQAACNKVIGHTSPVALELADPESIVQCAESILTLRSQIDILVCNAGVRGGGNERQRINGIEKHFAINHLGHFLFVNRLLERLYIAEQGRVVVVASRSAYKGAPEQGILFDNLGWDGDYDDRTAYGHSKLANVLFASELGRLLGNTRMTANSLHPGVINTEIDRNQNAVAQWAFGLLTKVSGKTIPEGAATSCYVATSPMLAETSSQYFEDCEAVTVSGHHHLENRVMADRLWGVSEDLLSDYIVRRRPEAAESLPDDE